MPAAETLTDNQRQRQAQIKDGDRKRAAAAKAQAVPPAQQQPPPAQQPQVKALWTNSATTSMWADSCRDWENTGKCSRGISCKFAHKGFPKAEKRRLLLPAGIAILLTVILLPKEFHTTLKINQTVSQQRSTKSRINSSEAAWSTFQKHPLLGYGNNNYTYAVDPLIGQDSTKPFTSIAPSLPVQLLVEKGIAGTLLYLLMGVIIVRILWQHRKDPDCRIIAATLTAVFFKDLTQATWLNTPFLLLTCEYGNMFHRQASLKAVRTIFPLPYLLLSYG